MVRTSEEVVLARMLLERTLIVLRCSCGKKRRKGNGKQKILADAFNCPREWWSRERDGMLGCIRYGAGKGRDRSLRPAKLVTKRKWDEVKSLRLSIAAFPVVPLFLFQDIEERY